MNQEDVIDGFGEHITIDKNDAQERPCMVGYIVSLRHKAFPLMGLRPGTKAAGLGLMS